MFSDQFSNLDFDAIFTDSDLQNHLNIIFGTGLGVSTALFVLMVASCVFACGAKGGKVDNFA